MTKYLALEQLEHYNEKIEDTYVKKEKKTNKPNEDKVLSDNNLTDELLEKIQNAGDSSFTGNYNDLTNIPTLDGTEIKGALTSEQLGLVKTEDLDEYISESDLETKLNDYATNSSVDDKLKSYETTSSVDTKLKEYATNSSVNQFKQEINSKISGVYTPKGSVGFYSLPPLMEDILGSVYNITDSFVTNDKFVEGPGHDYPAGTNVVAVEESTGVYKWDTLSGYLNIETITDQEIDALFE